MSENKINIQLVFAPKDALRAKEFFTYYSEYTIVSCPDEKRTNLKPKQERVCRFCRKQMPATTFKKDAHVISELLGNRYLVSDFECDTCNEVFGRYENDLAIFLGPLLAFQGIRGKKKLKSFKSADGRLRVDEDFLRAGLPCIRIQKTDPDDDSLTISRESGTTSISYTKGSYTPLKVYKALLKMALCCLPEADMPQYANAIQYLLSDQYDQNLTGAQKIIIHRKPYTFGHRSPLALFFKKNDAATKIPTHVFVLLFANVAYQLHLPLHYSDIQLFYNTPEGIKDVPVCPAFFADVPSANNTETSVVFKDLSATDLVRSEMERVLMQSSPQDLANAYTTDLTTMEHEKGANMEEIVQLIIARSDARTTLEEVAAVSQNKKVKK